MEGWRRIAEMGGFAPEFWCLQYCANKQIPLPQWMVERINKAADLFLKHKVAAPEEAFGGTRKPYSRQESGREGIRKWIPAYIRCKELEKKGMKKPELFRMVGEELGMSAGSVRTLYYDLYKHVEVHFGERQE